MLRLTLTSLLVLLLSIITRPGAARNQAKRPDCPDYSSFSLSRHSPFSQGAYQLPYQRPEPKCRTFQLSEVEDTIAAMKAAVKDPDLFRLFENCFPNTLDTAIAWKGTGNGTFGPKGEELTFITTGDINAMWLRDSANQLLSYRALLRPSSASRSLASLFRGAINLQARYLLVSPHCNAFHPPPEAVSSSSSSSSDRGSSGNPFASADFVVPTPDPALVFECKYELDSLAAFLRLSADYHAATADTAFFRDSTTWRRAVETLLDATDALRKGTWAAAAAGGLTPSAPYLFQRQTTTATETLMNGGAGSPVRGGTGMVRSAFRPSDDACTYQLFVPANMMFAAALEACAPIAEALNASLAARMAEVAAGVREGIERHGRVNHRLFGKIYAYEVDGFGSHNVMDDANVPSLLSAPMLGYVDRDDPIYQNTRRLVLSRENPYFSTGSVINSTGSPHVDFGMVWPMGLIVRILTSDDDDEIVASLRQLLRSTGGLGLIHESVNSNNGRVWTRQWFSWANGLFGQMMLDLRDRKPHLLALSYQPTAYE